MWFHWVSLAIVVVTHVGCYESVRRAMVGYSHGRSSSTRACLDHQGIPNPPWLQQCTNMSIHHWHEQPTVSQTKEWTLKKKRSTLVNGQRWSVKRSTRLLQACLFKGSMIAASVACGHGTLLLLFLVSFSFILRVEAQHEDCTSYLDCATCLQEDWNCRWCTAGGCQEYGHYCAHGQEGITHKEGQPVGKQKFTLTGCGCLEYLTCATCTQYSNGECGWCPSTFSCVPRITEDCKNVITSCTDLL